MNTAWEATRSRRASVLLAALFLVLGGLVGGCPQPVDPNDSVGGTPPVLDTANNSTIRSAVPLPLSDRDSFRFRGNISGRSDADVYALGTLAPGDRIVIDVRAVSGNLDAVAAIFDSREFLVAYNDDRNPDGSNTNPYLDITLRGDEGTYFLGVIGYPNTDTSGDYEVLVQLERSAGLPSTAGQVVYLNWAGGSDVFVPNVGTFNLGPFNAADVGFAAALTTRMKTRVQEIVANRYAGYNLVLRNSDEHAVPDGPHSTIFFGGLNSRAFAIAEKVDTFNTDPADRAIIFTQGFASAFRINPTFEEMCQAIGNTTAHEIGHLLGLVHTADCNDLMDTTCFNERLLTPQEFTTARLDTSVWPFGFQPAEEILGWLLGWIGL
ncbi:MAG: hypothetical protein IPM18_09620 [Phycisphaerales bacterium]|nr:hypothetical protein [Phycisphaerales bacterium]